MLHPEHGAPAAQPFAAAPTPFVATAAAPGPVTIPPVQEAGAPPPVVGEPPVFEPELPPLPEQPAPAPAPAPQKAARPKPSAPAGPPQPFPQWSAVLEVIAESDAMLYSFLQGTRAYYDGRRVLFECSDAFRDYIKKNKDVSKQIKETIYQVTHLNCFIGPYEAPRQEQPDSPAVSVDETLKQMQDLGVEVQIEEK